MLSFLFWWSRFFCQPGVDGGETVRNCSSFNQFNIVTEKTSDMISENNFALIVYIFFSGADRSHTAVHWLQIHIFGFVNLFHISICTSIFCIYSFYLKSSVCFSWLRISNSADLNLITSWHFKERFNLWNWNSILAYFHSKDVNKFLWNKWTVKLVSASKGWVKKLPKNRCQSLGSNSSQPRKRFCCILFKLLHSYEDRCIWIVPSYPDRPDLEFKTLLV